MKMYNKFVELYNKRQYDKIESYLSDDLFKVYIDDIYLEY